MKSKQGSYQTKYPARKGSVMRALGVAALLTGGYGSRETLMGGAPAAFSRFSGGRTEIGRNASFFGHNGSAT